MKNIVLYLIKSYQSLSRALIQNRALPMIYASSCKFYPSCSEYALESINKEGLIKGIPKSIRRIIRCNPWAVPRVDKP